jgi:hypothetical protein
LDEDPESSACHRCGLAYEEIYHTPWTNQAEQPKGYHEIMAGVYENSALRPREVSDGLPDRQDANEHGDVEWYAVGDRSVWITAPYDISMEDIERFQLTYWRKVVAP